MLDASVLDTIDLIYSAAIDPAMWAAVLSRLADMTGSVAGGLTIENPLQGTGRPLTFFGFDPDHVSRCFDHFLPMNPLFRIEAVMLPGFVVTNEMVVDTAQFRKSEFYHGWAKPQGLCSPLSVVLHRQADRYMPLTLVRPDGAGEASAGDVDLLKLLSPHLIRAMDIGLKMGRLDVFHGALQNCLDQLPVGVVLLDGHDRVLRVNQAAESYIREGAMDVRHGGIHISQASADSMMRRALAARHHNGEAAIDDVDLQRHGASPLIISVIPVVTPEESFDEGRIVTMLVIRSKGAGSGSIALGDFAAVHSLTAREQAVLELIAVDGLSLAESARHLDIGLATVRTHLQRTFDKTGTKRQAELLAKVFRSLSPWTNKAL